MSWYTPSTIAQACRQQHDLVLALDLARVAHHLLPVADRRSRPVCELEEDRRLGDVDAERHVGHAVLRAGSTGSPARRAPAEPDRGRIAPCSPVLPPTEFVVVVQMRQLEPVRLRRRPEVPRSAAAGPREERVALALVERPVADLRARDVADVARLEQEQRAEVARPRAPPAPGRAGTRAGGRSRRGPPSRRRRCPGAGVVATGNPFVVVIGKSPSSARSGGRPSDSRTLRVRRDVHHTSGLRTASRTAASACPVSA